VAAASIDDQLALIRAHPRLGSRGRAAADLTAASASEQRRAGLDACTADDLKRLDELNADYVATFDMPFILAVRGHDPPSIIGEAQRRVRNPAALERRQALHEIGLIAGYRLAERVTSPADAEVLAMCRRLAAQGAARPLLREWMLAADLEISEDGDSLIGRRRGKAVGPSGAADRTPSAGGLLESIVAIVMAQELHQRRVQLPFDVVVVARHSQAQFGMGLPDAAAVERARLTIGARWLQDTGLENTDLQNTGLETTGLDRVQTRDHNGAVSYG
jgi:OHCU decarboxylase